MLLNSVNPIDFVLDITSKKRENDEDNDKNTYKNLNQEDQEENLTDSNIINFNESERDSNYINNNTNKRQEFNQLYEPNRRKSKLLNCLIDKVFLNLTKFLKMIGPLFSITIITFLGYTYFSILKHIFPYWYKNFFPYKEHKIFYNVLKISLSIELILTIFNNILSVLVKPGNVSDLRVSKYYQTHSAYYSENLIFPSSFIKNNNIRNKPIKWRICKYCKEVKPLRTHHCSLCGTCVMKMDHHCPWINNCVGQNNHRYFLLFLFHVFCYTVIGCIITLPILFFKKKESDSIEIITKENFSIREVRYISVLGISSFVIELFFAGWNWFLAINGNTTLEFWADKTDFALDAGVRNFSFGSWRKNLFYVFGTENLFKILFVPSIKKLPFSGLEISKFVDPTFNIDGIN